MRCGSNIVIHFDSFSKKPKAGYTILAGGLISHHGTTNQLHIELSGLCRIEENHGYLDEEIIPYLEEDFQQILDFIEPSNIKQKIKLAKEKCTYFAYEIFIDDEGNVIVDRRH